jgi:hypothetical protein
MRFDSTHVPLGIPGPVARLIAVNGQELTDTQTVVPAPWTDGTRYNTPRRSARFLHFMISLCSWDTYAIEMSEKKKDINRAVRQVFKGIKCQQLADDLSTPEERRLPSNPLGNWEHD